MSAGTRARQIGAAVGKAALRGTARASWGLVAGTLRGMGRLALSPITTAWEIAYRTPFAIAGALGGMAWGGFNLGLLTSAGAGKISAAVLLHVLEQGVTGLALGALFGFFFLPSLTYTGAKFLVKSAFKPSQTFTNAYNAAGRIVVKSIKNTFDAVAGTTGFIAGGLVGALAATSFTMAQFTGALDKQGILFGPLEVVRQWMIMGLKGYVNNNEWMTMASIFLPALALAAGAVLLRGHLVTRWRGGEKSADAAPEIAAASVKHPTPKA